MSDSGLRLMGSIPIVVTPFTAEGGIDETGLRREVEHLVAMGVHGLATLGLASEGYKLTERERDEVARAVVEGAAGRVPVVVGVDHSGTEPAIERARRAVECGASGLMVLPPHFVKPDAAGLFRYYERIALASGLPIMIQDAPQLTGVQLPANFLARLHREIPGITAVKLEGSPAGPKTSEILDRTGGAMDVFAGWGGLSFWDGLLRGATGCMPAANFGADFARVYDFFVAGDQPSALSLFERIVPFVTWSMQSLDLSVWTAKQEFVRKGIVASSTLRDPAALPDEIDRAQFERFLRAVH